jgi:outer membrane protein OmpA-like peptidoglycan-associated protein
MGMAKKTQGSLTPVVAVLGCVLAAALMPARSNARVTIDRCVPAALATDGFILERPTRPGHLRFAGLLYLEYANDPVVWESVLEDSSSQRYDLVSDQFVAHPNFSLGLWNRVLAFVQLPVNAVVAGDAAAARRYGVQHDAGGSVGAFKLGGRVHILGEEADVVGLAAQLALGLPVADWLGATSTFAGENTTTAHLQAIGEFRLGRARIDVNAGFRLRKAVNVSNLQIGNEFTFAVGGSYPLIRGETEIRALLEMFGSSLTSDFGAREETPFEALTGLKLFREAWTVGIAGDLGLTQGYGSPFYRVLGTIGWASGSTEIVDDDDADEDGIIDAIDRCVNDPEDRDGFADGDGCPDLDNDGDGIEDANDKCPANAEDKDGVRDADGCPDLDNDNDGMLDANDQCPNEAETQNGIDDDDGCPDLVRIDKNAAQIYTLKPIRFETNSTVIHPDSLEMLKQIAGVLNEHPEITALAIAGHTDSKGNPKKNLKLSAGRAGSVREFLVQNGVAAERLSSNGLGAEAPVADNATAEGRAKNRRVEFNIVGVQQ